MKTSTPKISINPAIFNSDILDLSISRCLRLATTIIAAPCGIGKVITRM